MAGKAERVMLRAPWQRTQEDLIMKKGWLLAPHVLGADVKQRWRAYTQLESVTVHIFIPHLFNCTDLTQAENKHGHIFT